VLDLAYDYGRSPLAQRSPLQEVHVEANGDVTLVIGKSGVVLGMGLPPYRRKLEQAVRTVAELDRRGAQARYDHGRRRGPPRARRCPYALTSRRTRLCERCVLALAYSSRFGSRSSTFKRLAPCFSLALTSASGTSGPVIQCPPVSLQPQRATLAKRWGPPKRHRPIVYTGEPSAG